MEIKFREPRADEVEVRVAQVKKNGVQLLLYKDARVDATILDEAVGWNNWRCSYKEILGHLFCTVEVWDETKGEWIPKQNVGTESFTEATKGEASDALKRSCFTLGIARSLYSCPFIWIDETKVKIEEKNGKMVCKDTFKCTRYDVENGKVVGLTIVNSKGTVVYEFGSRGSNSSRPTNTAPKAKTAEKQGQRTSQGASMVKLDEALKTKLIRKCQSKQDEQVLHKLLSHYHHDFVDEMSNAEYEEAMKLLDKYPDKVIENLTEYAKSLN